MSRDWWIDEGDFAGAEHLDAAYVAGYEAKAQFDPTDDIVALEALGMGPGSTVVDLGAGTGVFAFAAAATGADVFAVDVSPAMTAVMRQRCRDEDIDNVTVTEAGLLSYEHEGPLADFVFSRNALHQLPDFWKVIALRRVAALIKPGATFRLRDLAYDLEPDAVEATIDDWLANAWSDPTTGYVAEDLAEHLRTEYSTFTWLLEPMLERVGFEILDRTPPPTLYPCYTLRRQSHHVQLSPAGGGAASPSRRAASRSPG